MQSDSPNQPTVGATFSEARQALGISPIEAADLLNLTLRTIEALEADDYESLPGRVYVNGYVRAYAKMLGLDADESALNRVYNICNGNPVQLWPLLDDVFKRLGLEPVAKSIPIHVAKGIAQLLEWHAKYLNGHKEPALTVYGIGTLTKTFAMDISEARQRLGYEPRQTVEEAIQEFIDWHKSTAP